MNDFTVNVVYKNKELENVGERVYTLKEYTEMIRFGLMRIITDVEDLTTLLQGGKDRSDWDDETMKMFKRIRHRILDESNAVKRLPDNMYYKGIPCNGIPSGEAIANIINKLMDENK